MRDSLLLYLQNLGLVSKELCDRIQMERDSEVLKQWMEIAFQSKSLEKFEKKIK